MLRRGVGVGALLLAGCSASEDGLSAGVDGAAGQAGIDAAADAVTPACPDDMTLVDAVCVDRFEAPNRAAELPLVMYTFYEAETWCEARDKRLCFDDEWTRGCAGALENAYPYGEEHEPGRCNDEQTWRLYDQSQLNGWPLKVSSPAVESLAELLDAARAVSASGQIAADHVEWLYQAEPSGDNAGCTGNELVFDTQGNVEEWTRRRDGGDGPDFSGNLKGRYWAEARTCQGSVKTHGNGFRFYEIGFRCCRDPA